MSFQPYMFLPPRVLSDIRNVREKLEYSLIDCIAGYNKQGYLLISVVHPGLKNTVELDIKVK